MSSPRLPFLQLTEVEQGSPNFAKQVAEQAEFYSSWRDVRSDGNCFYRAVSYGLLEHYCRPFTPVSEFKHFYIRLYYQETEPVLDENIADYSLVLRILKKLLDLKVASCPDLMDKAHELLACDSFLTPFIKVLRYVAWSSIKAFHPEPYYEGFEDDEETKKLLRDRHAAGDLDSIGIAAGLDVDLKLVEMGKANIDVITKTFEAGTRVHAQQPGKTIPSDPKGRVHLHIGLNAGHFLAFYLKELKDLEEERNQHYYLLKEADQENCERYARLIRT